MACRKALLVFILVTTTLSISGEMTTEPLVGGLPVPGGDFAFQVGIIGKYNGSSTRYMNCNGGILSDFYILANSECLFDSVSRLLKLRFYVVVSSRNIKDDSKNAKEVLYIYTYTSEPILFEHYVSVLQLRDSLNLESNRRLKKLILPDERTDYNLPARVAGYGYTWWASSRTRSRAKITSGTDFILTWAPVYIHDTDCEAPYDPMKDLCGKIVRRYDQERRGLCTCDEGAPLILGDNVVVAISNKNREDCDNTVFGNTYSKVLPYVAFINGVTQENYVPETVVHENRIHLTN